MSDEWPKDFIQGKICHTIMTGRFEFTRVFRDLPPSLQPDGGVV